MKRREDRCEYNVGLDKNTGELKHTIGKPSSSKKYVIKISLFVDNVIATLAHWCWRGPLFHEIYDKNGQWGIVI